jgi:toxin ParE1/3/4
MKRAIHRSQTARQDLVHAFRYYAREAGFRVAQRFFAQAEATFTRLASMPGMGAGYEHDHPALAGLRFAPVVHFRKYLVFYRAVADGIEIVRVHHGARDIASILAEQFEVESDHGDDENLIESEGSKSALSVT